MCFCSFLTPSEPNFRLHLHFLCPLFHFLFLPLPLLQLQIPPLLSKTSAFLWFTAYTPHSPCRYENTIGLVVERTRPKGLEGEILQQLASYGNSRSRLGGMHGRGLFYFNLSEEFPPTQTFYFHRIANLFLSLFLLIPDAMRWYCPSPAHKSPTIIKESRFICTDLGTQLKPVIDDWKADVEGRKCGDCGRVAGERELIEGERIGN